MVKNHSNFINRIIFMVLISTMSLFSQDSTEWLNYTNGDYIHCIKTEDSRLWIGTDGGLVSIDTLSGQTSFYNRSNSGLPSNRILSLEIDSKGNKWLGTSSGLAKFDNINWEVFNIDNSELETDYINEIAIDSTDVLWLGTYDGLYKFDQEEWELFKTSNSGLPGDLIETITIDKNNNIWMGVFYDDGRDGQAIGLVMFDRTSWTIYNIDNSDIQSNIINCIFITDQNEILIGGYAVFSIFNGETWINYNTTNSNIHESPVTSICQNNGYIWIGFNMGGVMQFDSTNGFLYSNMDYSSISDNIRSLNSDYKNKIYIGTDSGLGTYDGSQTHYINTSNSDIVANTIKALAIENGYIKWIGTFWGLNIFDGIGWLYYNTENSELPSNNILSAAVDSKGTKWIGTSAGLVKIKNDNWSVYTTENSVLPDNHIYTIVIEKNDVVWVGTGWKIVKIDGMNWTVYDPPNSNESMINEEQSILIDRDDNMWMARIDAGIVKYDGETWTQYNMSNSGLPDENIYAMVEDSSGNIWIGSNAGLTKFNGEEWITYNPSNSELPSKYIISLLVDKSDHLWIGTHNGGLVNYDKTNWTVYNTMNSGLPSNTITSLLMDNNENLWIGTYQGGLAVFQEGGIINKISENKYHNLNYHFKLDQNYPNPFNPTTIINYELAITNYVELAVYNSLGQKIQTLVNEKQAAGNHSVTLDAGGLSSGTYFVQLQVDNSKGRSIKVNLVK